MALPAEIPTQDRDEPFEEKLARLRATNEERARLLAAARPFDAEDWLRGTEPATDEELADLDEFLAEVERLRQDGLQRHEPAQSANAPEVGPR